MSAPELSPAEAVIVARFDAAPTLPEDAEAALIEATAAALAEDANAGAVFDPIDLDPEMYEVYEEDREYFRGQARAALAVFRGQQDPAVQRVLEVADGLDVKAERVCATSAHACAAYANAADRIRAALSVTP